MQLCVLVYVHAHKEGKASTTDTEWKPMKPTQQKLNKFQTPPIKQNKKHQQNLDQCQHFDLEPKGSGKISEHSTNNK